MIKNNANNKFRSYTTHIRSRSVLFLLFLLLIAVNLSGLYALESWPISTDWVMMINNDWEVYQNSVKSERNKTIDLIPDNNGEIAYYWSSNTSLFFRMTLAQTPEIFGRLVIGSWFIALDLDVDNYMDWFIQLDGVSQALYCYPNADSYPDNIPDNSANFTVSSPISAGYARIVSAGTIAYPGAVYLDIQIPFTALDKIAYSKNVSNTTPFLMFYATNRDNRIKIKDAIGTSRDFSGAFSQSMIYTPYRMESNARIYDTRDSDPYGPAGIWYRNENISVSGFRWPTSNSPYYNAGSRNARITDSGDNIVWSGVITTTTSGELVNTTIWTPDLSVPSDIYTIYIEDPLHPGTYNIYDSFEIQSPNISVQKTSSTPIVSSGENVNYSIQIQNTGDVQGNISDILDILPTGFTYVSGSSSGLTTGDPIMNGDQISWQGNWAIPVSGSVIQNFTAKSTFVRGDYKNNVTISGTNFTVKNSGPTANVQIIAPVLSLVKSVNKPSGQPGETVTYTVNYNNSGDDNASVIFIFESISSTTEYLTSSAVGSGMTITYSHDGGITYNSNQTAPVTHLSFQRSTALTPGSSGSISYQVIIK
ncbi:MAG: DUF11 domain-containing protein [Candidatus Marinimicrobia bacterium]|nr:DUF11 domain-containing protein [Candidatus Neomarinimicrobiota bacterium]